MGNKGSTAGQPQEPNWERHHQGATGSPDMDCGASTVAQQFGFKVYTSLDDLLARLESRRNLEVEAMGTICLQIAPRPFSDQGTIRWPFHALVENPVSGMTIPMVVKSFKVPSGGPDVHQKERYLQQMEVQAVAAQLAQDFGSRTRDLPGARKMTFSTVTTLQVEGASGEQCRFYNMEEPLKAEWKKFSCNSGYVDKSDYAHTLHAFSHWTYERSRGHLLVGDLQGVRVQNPGSEDEFWLSDPAIYSKDLQRFTQTNMGEAGFKLFHKTHECNDVCRALKLKPLAL